MRTVHWLFVVSIALFVSGIGFVVAGARSVRRTPTAQAGVAIVPVASVKQIMKGIVGPAATTIFNAVGTTVSSSGVEEKAPHTDEEWEVVGNSAAALIESGNLMLIGSRMVDKNDWVRMSQAMIEAGKVTLRAVQSKDTDQVFASGEAINESCDNCHQKYQRGS